ncbi:MAG: hypothetical protein SGILL_001266 [Bacillariaceae sp.]
MGVYEMPLKDESELTPPRVKKPGFGRGKLLQRSNSSSSLSLSSGVSNLDSSTHLRDLVENDNTSCHLSLQNSVHLTRNRKSRVKVEEILEDSLSVFSFEADIADIDNTSISSRLSALTSDSDRSIRQRVRFRLSKNVNYPPSDDPLTEEEIDQAWWTTDDYNEAVDVTEDYIDKFHKINKEPMQDLIRLVALCYKAKDDAFEDLKHAVSLTPNVSRGFESEIIHPLKKSRKRHTKSVLNVIRKNPEDPEKAAECSKVLSRPHNLLAVAYAQRDHQAAREAASKPWKKRRSPAPSSLQKQ